MTRFLFSAAVSAAVTAVLFVCLAWLISPGLVVCGAGMDDYPAVENDGYPEKEWRTASETR